MGCQTSLQCEVVWGAILVEARLVGARLVGGWELVILVEAGLVGWYVTLVYVECGAGLVDVDDDGLVDQLVTWE